MTSARLDLQQAVEDLLALDQLLLSSDLEETGSGSLQEFFAARPNLLLLIPGAFISDLLPAAYLAQCSILHEFRADYAVANNERSKFIFIEFEHAKEHSIFAVKATTKAHQSYQWSRSFEHGFSQIVDWRRRHTVINSLHVHCVTFDELARELRTNCNRLLATAQWLSR